VANDNDNPYTGTYRPRRGAHLRDLGTTIPAWLDQRREELVNRTFCFDLAFASRGGNDFGNDNDAEYKDQLKELVLLLARGSSCRTDPIIVVTGHMPTTSARASRRPFTSPWPRTASWNARVMR